MMNTRKISVALVLIIAISMMCCMFANAWDLPTLRYGSSGDYVYLLQQLLGSLEYNPGPVDGEFGRQTLDAVRKFQGDHGLSKDGIVGKQTWNAIYADLS